VSELLQVPLTPTMPSLEDDRRLVSRVLKHILQSAIAGHLPRLNDVDPWLVGDDWSSCALVRIRKPLDQSVFIVVSDKLLPNPAVILDREPISHCSPTALLGVVLFFLAEAVEERAAIMVEGGRLTLMLPFSFGPCWYRSRKTITPSKPC
jgi:hypothetical protein